MTKLWATAVAVASTMGTVMAANFFDPVTLENAYLRLTVDRQRGATVRSMIDKVNHIETAREFKRGQDLVGALAEDRIAGEGYPGYIPFLHYQGSVKRTGEAQILSLVSRQTKGRYAGWEFTKTFTLPDKARYFEVKWQIKNIGTTTRTITPWVHNIVNTQYRNTVLPKKDGVKLIAPSADYFNVPRRNWLAGYNPNLRQMIYFLTDFNQTFKHYYCFWNGYHAMEWTFMAANLKPGETWTGVYRIGLAAPRMVPAAVSPDVVAAYEWKNSALELELTPTANLGLTEFQILVNGKAQPRKSFNFNLGQNYLMTIPAPVITKPGVIEVKVFQNGQERLQQTAQHPEMLKFQVDFAGRNEVTSAPILPWQVPATAYKKIVPQTHRAKIHFTSSELTVGETSPYDKFFEEDKLQKSTWTPEVRTMRNCQFYRQIVVQNTAKQPVTLQIDNSSCTLRCGKAKLPFTVRQVGYIATRDPSFFDANYAVGRYPDYLLPLTAAGITLKPGQSVPLFIVGQVDFKQPAGLYQGALEFKLGAKSVKVPVSCQVMTAALPERSLMFSTIGCWGVSTKVLKAVGFKGTQREFSRLSRMICYQNRLTPRENGVSWNFKPQMEEQLEELKLHHATSVNIPRYVVKNSKYMAQAVAALKRHNLYHQAFFYTIDEAPAAKFPEVKKECQAIHKVYPDFKILGTIYEKDVSYLFGDINIWCRTLTNAPWESARRAAGDAFLSSNLGGTELEAQGIDAVNHVLRLKRQGCNGFLYWNIIAGYGKDNPWEDISCSGFNGNAHLLYPHSSGPLESLRFKHMAHGVELFEQLVILEKTQPDVYAKLIKQTLQIKNWVQLEKFRTQVLNQFK